jgi:hypothetical protein
VDELFGFLPGARQQLVPFFGLAPLLFLLLDSPCGQGSDELFMLQYLSRD